jgi:large repetitive protein
MMYLARLTLGSKPQVFHLTGFLFAEPKSWSFCSYRRGACAIGTTWTAAAEWSPLSAPAGVCVADPPPPTTAMRINSGGPAYYDTQRRYWTADNGFIAGRIASTPTVIGNTDESFMYQTWRSALTGYEIAVPNGDYVVRLHFAEGWTGGQAVGKRVFDVSIEGATVLDDLDVFAQAGGYKALMKQFDVTVRDGGMSIGFVKGVADEPMVAGLEIMSSSIAPPPPPPPPRRAQPIL